MYYYYLDVPVIPLGRSFRETLLYIQNRVLKDQTMKKSTCILSASVYIITALPVYGGNAIDVGTPKATPTFECIGIELPFTATFLIMAMASLGVIIPSAPGFIGTFHLAVQYGFLFFGIAKEEALSAAIIWHAAFFFPTIFFGALCLLYIHFTEKTAPA